MPVIVTDTKCHTQEERREAMRATPLWLARPETRRRRKTCASAACVRASERASERATRRRIVRCAPPRPSNFSTPPGEAPVSDPVNQWARPAATREVNDVVVYYCCLTCSQVITLRLRFDRRLPAPAALG